MIASRWSLFSRNRSPGSWAPSGADSRQTGRADPRGMPATWTAATARRPESPGFRGDAQSALTVPIKTWDERLTSGRQTVCLSKATCAATKRKEKVDKMAAAILRLSYHRQPVRLKGTPIWQHRLDHATRFLKKRPHRALAPQGFLSWRCLTGPAEGRDTVSPCASYGATRRRKARLQRDHRAKHRQRCRDREYGCRRPTGDERRGGDPAAATTSS